MWLAHAALITQASLSQHTITGNTACHYNVHAHASVLTHATCRSAHVSTLHPDTCYHAPSILHPQFTAHALHTLGPQRLEERIDFFFFLIPMAALLPFLAFVHKGQELFKKADPGPTPSSGRVGARDCVISVEGQEALYCLLGIWHDCILQTSHAKPNVHSTSSVHVYQSLCPLNQALFCHWNVLSPFLGLLKSPPFPSASCKSHLP